MWNGSYMCNSLMTVSGSLMYSQVLVSEQETNRTCNYQLQSNDISCIRHVYLSVALYFSSLLLICMCSQLKLLVEHYLTRFLHRSGEKGTNSI